MSDMAAFSMLRCLRKPRVVLKFSLIWKTPIIISIVLFFNVMISL